MVKTGLSQRDIDILLFINEFGKSYSEIIHKCFFSNTSEQVCKNRLTVLKTKYNLIKHTATDAISPRYYISLTEAGKRYIYEELGVEYNPCFFSLSSLNHNFYEQLVFFALKKAGKEPMRTKVIKWSKEHNHTPDIAYCNGEKLVYVEIEISRKSTEVYNKIFNNIIKDGVSNIIYLAKDEKWKDRFLTILPKFDGLRVADIDTFFDIATKEGKIVADKQENREIEK